MVTSSPRNGAATQTRIGASAPLDLAALAAADSRQRQSPSTHDSRVDPPRGNVVCPVRFRGRAGRTDAGDTITRNRQCQPAFRRVPLGEYPSPEASSTVCRSSCSVGRGREHGPGGAAAGAPAATQALRAGQREHDLRDRPVEGAVRLEQAQADHDEVESALFEEEAAQDDLLSLPDVEGDVTGVIVS
jgi:hypothetical protein